MDQDAAEMTRLAPDLVRYVWPQCSYQAINESLCYHACVHRGAVSKFDISMYKEVNPVVNTLERMYASTKVVLDEWPVDFGKFIRESVDWNSSPGWPWKRHYPTNRDLFLFDGINLAEERVKMVEEAVKTRWAQLMHGPVADPIHLFVKQEPHKAAKAEKQSWRLISGVGLTDSLVDRLLYGKWLDSMIVDWSDIPSKAGWAPQLGGFRWLAKNFRSRNKEPVSIDKSAWDWTVNEWHVLVMRRLIPRMIFGISADWYTVFEHRFDALYGIGNPIFKPSCGCEFVQLVPGIQKSGCLGTIAFNSIWQVAIHLAAGGSEDDVIFSLGDDTVQDRPKRLESYVENLGKLGAIVKEIDEGWPIKFGGHEIDEVKSIPAYKGKHMFALLHLDEDFGPETLESYRHLYALDEEMSGFLERLALRKYGPKNLLSRQYLREWYLALE